MSRPCCLALGKDKGVGVETRFTRPFAVSYVERGRDGRSRESWRGGTVRGASGKKKEELLRLAFLSAVTLVLSQLVKHEKTDDYIHAWRTRRSYRVPYYKN